MTLVFPQLVVGAPLSYGPVSVFPLRAESHGQLNYVLSDEALARGSVHVTEVSEGGSVPELLVRNTGGEPVLFIEGEELIGARQNRVLNTSVLIGAGATVRIPVSCVEQGRWSYRSRKFGSGGTSSSPSLRHSLKKSVTRSVRDGRGHRSDQREVWDEIARKHKSLKTSSPTGAMHDIYDSHGAAMEKYRQALSCPQEAVGLVVTLGGQIAAVDVFDKPSTCRKVWERLLSGFVLDALEIPEGTVSTVSVDKVRSFLQAARTMPWGPCAPIGEGEEFRAGTEQGVQASALVYDSQIVHGSLIAAV